MTASCNYMCTRRYVLRCVELCCCVASCRVHACVSILRCVALLCRVRACVPMLRCVVVLLCRVRVCVPMLRYVVVSCYVIVSCCVVVYQCSRLLRCWLFPSKPFFVSANGVDPPDRRHCTTQFLPSLLVRGRKDVCVCACVRVCART